jgi:hypothetical protein
MGKSWNKNQDKYNKWEDKRNQRRNKHSKYSNKKDLTCGDNVQDSWKSLGDTEDDTPSLLG